MDCKMYPHFQGVEMWVLELMQYGNCLFSEFLSKRHKGKKKKKEVQKVSPLGNGTKE